MSASGNKVLFFFPGGLTMSKVVAILIAFVMVYSLFNVKPWKKAGKKGKIIAWDVTSYYGYLPAYFIHDDLSLEFIRSDEQLYANKMKFWPKKTKDNRYVFKMTMGMSFLYAPFFLISHYLAGVLGYAQDGFSLPYEMGLAFSSMFYLLIGLFLLRKVLRRFFPEWISSAVLVLVFFATNLYYYGITEPCLTHAYNFSLVCILLYSSIKWHDKPRWYFALLVGLSIGLLTLIRPTNAIYFSIPLLYGFQGWSTFKTLVTANWKHIALLFGTVSFVLFPQLFYWHFATGSWIYYSYVDEQFFWTNPHILESLFAYRNGWLLYSPVMLLALIGLFYMRKYVRPLFPLVPVLIAVNIFIISSWWCWWYAGSFGGRAYVDSYPVLAIALGCFLSAIISDTRKRWRSFVVITFGLGLITLSGIQTQQRRLLHIHWDSMTKEAYWNQFLKLERVNGYEDMIKSPDYQSAMRGEDEYYFEPF